MKDQTKDGANSTGTKFTKGEWEINSQRNLVKCGGKWVADLGQIGFDRVSDSEREANAKLIEQAPKMYATLQQIKSAGLKALEMDANGESVSFKNILGYMAELAELQLKATT